MMYMVRRTMMIVMIMKKKLWRGWRWSWWWQSCKMSNVHVDDHEPFPPFHTQCCLVMTTLLVYHRSRSSESKTEEKKESAKHHIFNQIFVNQIFFSQQIFCAFSFFPKCTFCLRSARVWVSLKPNSASYETVLRILSSIWPSQGQQWTPPSQCHNCSSTLKKCWRRKCIFWQQKSMFMPNQIQTKLFINTTLITIEQAFGSQCIAMTLQTTWLVLIVALALFRPQVFWVFPLDDQIFRNIIRVFLHPHHCALLKGDNQINWCIARLILL